MQLGEVFVGVVGSGCGGGGVCVGAVVREVRVVCAKRKSCVCMCVCVCECGTCVCISRYGASFLCYRCRGVLGVVY